MIFYINFCIPSARGDARVRRHPRSASGTATQLSGQRAAALVGIFAIVWQAILFGWHHHDIRFTHRGTLPIAAAPTSGSHPLPGSDDDGCEICGTLHHQSASPVEFVALPPYQPVGLALPSADAVLVGLAYPAAFQSRAPPSA
jgi:hypothetical protein